MNNNTQKFLTLLKLDPNSNIYESLILYKVKYDKIENSGKFWFHISENFTEIFEKIKSQLVRNRLTFEIYFSHTNQLLSIPEQIKCIILDVIKYKANSQIIKNINWDNIVDVNVNAKVINLQTEYSDVYYFLTNIYNLIILMINHYQWKYKLDVRHNESNDWTITKEIHHKTREYNLKHNHGSYDSYDDKYEFKTMLEFNSDKYNDKKIKSKISGQLIKIETKTTTTKYGKTMYIINIIITDFLDSVDCVIYAFTKKQHDFFIHHKKQSFVTAYGTKIFNSYKNDYALKIEHMKTMSEEQISKICDFSDNTKEVKKRIELNSHTKMSTMDGCSDVEEYIQNAIINYKHNALAITDVNSVQSFPNAYLKMKAIKNINPNFKLIYGTELFCIDNNVECVINDKNLKISDKCIVTFDLETTGLYANFNEIIEIAAVKKDDEGKILKFQRLIKIDKKIPKHIVEITNINDEMLKNEGVELNIAIDDFVKFCKGCVLIAHNLKFDYSFIKKYFKNHNDFQNNTIFVDSLWLSRLLIKSKAYRLESICKKLKISYDSNIAHRALYDSEVLLLCYINLIKLLNNLYPNIDTYLKLQNMFNDMCRNNDRKITSHIYPYSIILLAKNNVGLKNIYKLVSLANTKYFTKKPTINWEVVNENRDGLIVISPFCKGELLNIYLSDGKSLLNKSIKKYDFCQIEPYNQLKHLAIDNKIESISIIKNIIADMIQLCNENNIMCYASSAPYYVHKYEKIVRNIIINSKQINGISHYLYNWNNITRENPDSHYYKTDELLHLFNFLGKEAATNLVIKNTHYIASLIHENIEPLKSNLYKPNIEGALDKLKNYTNNKVIQLYGNNPPSFILNRIQNEYEKILSEGYEIVYWISHLIVKKSNDNGFLVGSRGSVGSSFIAYLCDITEVNPLEPHYRCKKCKYCEFAGQYADSGFDLPAKPCPNCNINMYSDGQKIPFETFLGFSGEKVPDIDLNFAASYQSIAHKYCMQLFGQDHIFRAGTVNTIQNKTAYALVLSYLEQRYIKKGNAEVERLCNMLSGIKRTTGQHPGGLIVVPKNMNILDFTPYNYPADDLNSEWFTTHFDFNAIHDNLLKLDLLGHLDPEILNDFKILTNKDPKNVPFIDINTMQIFKNSSFLGKNSKKSLNSLGTLGVPEFGTTFVMKILEESQPKTFADLIRICGLAHGTNVWLNNARELVMKNNMKLSDLITCRDDIMNYLVSKKINEKISFQIMESVRKGKGIDVKYNELLIKHNIDKWYIDCCNSIKYMFPKAHAAAYVINAWRVAWYKYYFPLEFYSIYLTRRSEIYDYPLILYDNEKIKYHINKIESKSTKLKAKDMDLLSTLKIIYEMRLRGIEFEDINLYSSDSKKFIPLKHKNKILLPFKVITGLGEETANSIIKCREEKPFIDIMDLKKRTKLNKNQIVHFKRFFI